MLQSRKKPFLMTSENVQITLEFRCSVFVLINLIFLFVMEDGYSSGVSSHGSSSDEQKISKKKKTVKSIKKETHHYSLTYWQKDLRFGIYLIDTLIP